jgi:hypothetical protein
VTGVFGHRLGSTWVVGAVSDGVARLYDSAGGYLGRRPMQGTIFSPAPDGGLVTTDGRYVRKYDANLQRVFYFGGTGSQRKPAPGQFDFYLQGGAVQLKDGRYVVADSGHGLEVFSPKGILLGTIPDQQLGYLTQDSALQVSGSTLYLAIGTPFSDTQTLSTMRLSDVVREALQPGATASLLGIGAGVRIAGVAAYFPPGETPSAAAVFDPWWSQLKNLNLRYTVQDSVQAETRGDETYSVVLTSAAIRRGAALHLPAAVPGPYEIDVRLFVGHTAVSAQCVDYSVGAPGDRLNLSQLPGSWDAGGVSGDRGAALANVFGMGGVRISLDWTTMLPDGPSGPTDFSPYDAEIAAASQEAASRHVVLSVQVGSGGPERAFVDNGTWAARVTQVVEHWKSEVHYWEAWNEPNATYGSAQDYVQNVLAPFYTAVKAADSTAQVIGGTVVGMDLGYWQGIAAAGGFKYMDIAAIHPYTGHNRSWEEQGFPAAFRSLRTLMAANGAAAVPVWITELAWWSNGPNDFFGQADRTARAQLWMRALGIPVWEYFIPQGTWGNAGLTFSLIQGDSLVKPAALAAMVETTQTSGRPFVGWLPTAMPMTYAESFGAHTAGGDTVVALWTDDVALSATIRLERGDASGATLVDEYGAAHRVSLAVPLHVTLDGAVQYLELPPGDQVRIRPPEPFGADVALARLGATASASSSTPWNPAADAIDGDAGAANVGELAGSPAWGSAYGDENPELTVRFAHDERIDRVLLVTSSVGNTMPGIRSWQVDADTSGAWRVVAAYNNLFYARAALTKFAPVDATAIRIKVERVNFGGYAGGAEPSFWPKSTPSAATQPNDYAYGPAVIREVEAYTAG